MVDSALIQMRYVHRRFEVIFTGTTELWNWDASKPDVLLHDRLSSLRKTQSPTEIISGYTDIGQAIWIGRKEWYDRFSPELSSGTRFSALIATPVMHNPDWSGIGNSNRNFETNSPLANVEGFYQGQLKRTLDSPVLNMKNSPQMPKSVTFMKSPQTPNATEYRRTLPPPSRSQLFQSVYSATKREMNVAEGMISASKPKLPRHSPNNDDELTDKKQIKH